MPYIEDESKVKRPTDFTKLEDGDVIILQSKVYSIPTHFLATEKRSVYCIGDGCYFCGKDMKARDEYFYYGLVNGEKGIMRVPATVLYSIAGQEKLIKKNPKTKDLDKRDFEWIIGKTGSGLDTEYTVMKNDKITRISDDQMEKNKTVLITILTKYENMLKEKAMEIVAQDKEVE